MQRVVDSSRLMVVTNLEEAGGQFAGEFKNMVNMSPHGKHALEAGSEVMSGLAAMAGVGSVTRDTLGHRLAPLPGIGCDAIIDDDDCAVVLVLPKVSDESAAEVGAGSGCCGGGASTDEDGSESQSLVKDSARVKDPASCAKKVFLRELPFMRECELQQSSMTVLEYQKMMRQALREVIVNKAGLQISSFESIDHDVIFWKVTASRARLQQLAAEFSYTTTYHESAYEAVDMEPPEINGIVLHAHGKFMLDRADDFEELMSMDDVRLVLAALSNHVKLDALQPQHIIERWFPAAKFDEMKNLTDSVIGWPLSHKVRCLPQERDADHIRNYFGSEIAGFFSFYNMLILSKRWPAMVGVLVAFVRRFRPASFHLTWMNTVFAGFGCLVIVWGMYFVSHAEHGVEMDRMRWGSDSGGGGGVRMSDYEPKNRGNWKQGLYSAAGKGITFVFLIIVVVTCTLIALKVPDKRLSPILQTATTFAFSFIWGKIAKNIVKLENKRTLAAFNRALTLRLTFVKLFIFFTPLLRLAFLSPIAARHCVHHTTNATAAAQHVAKTFYAADGLPHNLKDFNIAEDSEDFLSWVDTMRIDASKNPIDYFLMMVSDLDSVASGNVSSAVSSATSYATTDAPKDEMCFRGCYPKICEISNRNSHTELQCYTSCAAALERSLNMLYLTHAVCTIVFILVPMLQVRWAARREIEEGEGQVYSLIQYQEKCHMQASYEYESWGGSYVEDFVEVILSFSVICCFSIVSPSMLIIGFIAQVFEYRLLVYRMTWITCRPFPSRAEGLSEWFLILDVVLYIAICMNSLLLICVLRTDLDHLGAMEKLIVVVIITLTLIAIKVLLRISLHEQPREIQEAIDQNNEFIEALDQLRSKPETFDHQRSHDHVKIGVLEE